MAFTFSMMKVDVWIIPGIFRVNRKLIFYLKLLCNFRWKVIECKFTWHSFSYSSIPPVSKYFWPWCYAQHNLFITFIGNAKLYCPIVSKKERMVGHSYFLPNSCLNKISNCILLKLLTLTVLRKDNGKLFLCPPLK